MAFLVNDAPAYVAHSGMKAAWEVGGENHERLNPYIQAQEKQHHEFLGF